MTLFLPAVTQVQTCGKAPPKTYFNYKEGEKETLIHYLHCESPMALQIKETSV